MKKFLILFSIMFLSFYIGDSQEKHTVNVSSLSFSPATVNAKIGDIVVLPASAMHPIVQVSESVWNANASTELSGGWGTKTNSFEFTVSEAGTIYYVCANHVGSGMKGKIVTSVSSIEDISKLSEEFVVPSLVYDVFLRIHSEYSIDKVFFEIYDLSGKMMWNKLIEVNTHYFVSIPDGLYVYKLTIGNEVNSGKILFK